ncbi:cyclin-like protein interacting with PHO85 [Marasmius tenuissimus]|uniref:Cyclin-like protein interacting with PHO85 n=1 Tax=Marasmius tenuissimus TaxID=585030 RepID=A0ABR2ZIH2_9AGAR
MLALAHPYDPSSEIAHRASSSSIPRQRTTHRKPSSSSSSSSAAPVSTSRHPSSSSMPSAVTPSSSRHTYSSQQQQPQQQSHPQPQPTQPPQPSVAQIASPQKTSTSPRATSSPKVESVTATPVVSETFDIHSYPSSDLLRLLASLLSQIAAANDKLDSSSSVSLAESHSNMSSYAPASPSIEHAPFWRTLTTASRTALATPSSTLTFHARNIPTITLEAYLLRILKYCPTTNEVFLSLLVYFDRMSKLSADATGRTFVIDSYNIHRLVIAGVTVASKFFSDVFYTNSRYAKVGGLPLAELNQLELQFLLLNDFNLVIPTDEMQRYAEQLILFSTSPTQPKGIHPTIRPSIQPCSPSPTPSSPSSSSTSSVASYSSSGSSTAVPGNITPQSSTSSFVQYPSDPETTESQSSRMRAMGAIDAYGGKIPGAVPMPTVPGAYATMDGVSMQRDTGAGMNASATYTYQTQQMMKTPRRGSDAASVYSVSSQSDADTETEAETETDGGWTTDDEPTIRAGANGGSVSGSTCGDSVCGDSSFDEGERSDAGDVEVEDATRMTGVPVGRGPVLRRAGRGASEGGVEGDDEREEDSMEFDDEAVGSNMVVDVERTPDSERVWRGGRRSAGMNVNL